MTRTELLRTPLPKPHPEKHKDYGTDNTKPPATKCRVRINRRRWRRGWNGFYSKRANSGRFHGYGR